MCTDATNTDDTPATRLATRLAFLAAGFAMACWAPLVPYAKARLGVDEAGLGLLLLCLGIGSVGAMPVAGIVIGRVGARPVILTAGIGLCLALPGLALAATPVQLALVLLLFGAALGSMDVAMNVHAVAVEKAAPRPLMSGFHGLFSVGGMAGAGAVTTALAAGASPAQASLAASVAVAAAIALAGPRLLRHAGGAPGPLWVRPHGMVLLLGVLAFAAFLTEGAILDWTALLLTQAYGLDAARAGIGYTLFSAAMTLGRLTGDRVVGALGARRALLWGGLVASGGLVLQVVAPNAGLALAGILLTGLGASNLVPVLFSASGRQHAMPVGLAVTAMSSLGYAGILCGPALMGAIAHATGLPAAFLMLAVLLLSLPAASRVVTR